MKVVLFCGGLGMRLRDYSESVPKPMINIGYRPVLWHVMKYYAHYGHKDFILCLGYKGDTIKNYFLSYNECLSNDFILSNGGKQVQLLGSDIHDWKITFVDTGLTASIGERLKAVEKHLRGERVFLANYSDGLTDLPLPKLLEHFTQRKKVASFLCVQPTQSFHLVSFDTDDTVSAVKHINRAGVWINGGYFVFRNEIFKHLKEGEELVVDLFPRLIEKKELIGYRYTGFWSCMDTLKDKQQLDDMYSKDQAPWMVWVSRQKVQEVRSQQEGE
jgi:glucose-1-phosphate cytidylyltransferase